MSGNISILLVAFGNQNECFMNYFPLHKTKSNYCKFFIAFSIFLEGVNTKEKIVQNGNVSLLKSTKYGALLFYTKFAHASSIDYKSLDSITS